MKKIIFAVMLLSLACASSLSAQAVLKGKAVVIWKTAEFWTLNGKAMQYVETLTRGQELGLDRGTAKGTYKGKEFNLQRVILDSGKEGYVIETLIAKEPMVGVVKNELATLYSQPRDTAVMATVLPVGNLVALWPVTGKTDFYMVTAYEGDTWNLHKEKYISASDVSMRPQDVNVVLLLDAASIMPKKEQKKKILDTISAKYSDTAMTVLVEKLRAEVGGETAAPRNLEPEAEAESYQGTFKALKPVNVREKPSTGAKVVKVIEADEIMDVVGRSPETATIGSDTDYWYLIDSPAEGWVFGAFIEESKP